jgi:WD40 repeat protein
MRQLASIGGALPGNLVWSPDGKRLAVGTSRGTLIYDATDLQKQPLKVNGDGQVYFVTNTELSSGNGYWDVKTGQQIPNDQLSTIKPRLSPSGKIEIITRQSEEALHIDLKRQNGRTTTLAIDCAYDLQDIVFNPDETFAALAISESNSEFASITFQLWNIETGALIANLPQSFEIIDKLEFHADGKLLITATHTDAIYGGPFDNVTIWDGRTGKAIGSGGLPLVYSPNNQFFAFVGGSGVLLWSDHEIGTLETNYYNSENSSPPVFSPDNHSIAVPGIDTVLLWSLDHEAIAEKPDFTFPANGGTEFAYSPDGKVLVAQGDATTITVWDLSTGIKQQTFTTEEPMSLMGFSADGQLLRAENSNRQIFWDVQTGAVLASTPGWTGLNADWSRAAYWKGGDVVVVNVQTSNQTVLPAISPYFGRIVGFSPTAEWAMFEGEQLQGYDLAAGKWVFTSEIENASHQIAFTPDGQYFIDQFEARPFTGDSHPTLQYWSTSAPDKPLSTTETDNSVGDLLSPDGNLISNLGRGAGCDDGGGGSYQLQDAHTGLEIAYLGQYGCGPYSHAFTPDSKWVIVGWTSEITLIDLKDTVQSKHMNLHTISPDSYFMQVPASRSIVISQNGRWFAVSLEIPTPDAPEDQPTYRVDVFDLRQIIGSDGKITPTAPVLSILDTRTAFFSPDDRYLLTDSGFWNLQTGKQVANISASVAAFNPAGTLLVTYGEEGLSLWDVGALGSGTAKPLATLPMVGTAPSEIAFNPDGTRLFVRTNDGVSVWGVPN